jgi:hypothetical protein
LGQDGIEDPNPRRFDLCDSYCVPGLQPQEFIVAEEPDLQIIHKDKFDGELISQVMMMDEKVEVTYKEKADILIEYDHIKTSIEKCTAELSGEKMNLTNGKDKITVDSGNVEVSTSTKATIKDPQVAITGGQFSLKGTVTSGIGHLCALPNCLFTGALNGGDTVTRT